MAKKLDKAQTGNKGPKKAVGQSSKGGHAKRRPNTRRLSNSDASAVDEIRAGVNPLVASMSKDSMTGDISNSYQTTVFAAESAMMQSFGSFTTTPGQDNFIEQFNSISNNDEGGYDWRIHLTSHDKRTPNAMAIGITPWFGALDVKFTGTWMSPLQLAAVNLKQYIDTSFGTNTAYDPQDLMMYLLGIYAVFPVIAEIKRDIRLILTYQTDHYPQFVPQGLFTLLHLPDGEGRWQSGEGALYAAHHLREYVDTLNLLIDTFNRLPMPPEIKAFGYNDEFFDHIYMDTEDLQTAQLYVFENTEYWLYEETPEQGAQLIYLEMGTSNIGQKLQYLSSQIQRLSALRTSSTSMLQNLFNAYGSRDQVIVPRLDVNAIQPLDFVYNQDVLTMINNMVVCAKQTVTMSYITPDHESSDVKGHFWINEEDLEKAAPLCINIPLQFHKPYEQVTANDIGWAMRLHPMFRIKKRIPLTGPSHTGEFATVMTADTHTGFAICRKLVMAAINDNGTISTYSFVTRTFGTNAYLLGDFKAHPVSLDVTVEFDTTALTCDVTLNKYDAERDVEATYRLDDLAMHWTYLTMDLWGANINRNVIGSRVKGI